MHDHPEIKTKAFKHWNLWVWSRLNVNNTNPLVKLFPEDIQLHDLVFFLNQILFTPIVPNRMFREGQSIRVTSLCTSRSYEVEENESRFLKFIQKSSQKLSGHNRVLVPILKSDPQALGMEIPVWCERFWVNGQWLPVTGHIDLLEYDKDERKLYIWDYKPDGSKTVGDQVSYYKRLMTQLTFLDLERIVCGWFTEDREYIIKGE